MCEGHPVSQWGEQGKQHALVSTRGVREAEGSSCFSCGFSFCSPCLKQWVCDFLWVQPNAAFEWQTLQRTARSWNVFAVVSLNPEQNQWGSCNLLALGLPKLQHAFLFQSGRLALALLDVLTAQPVWFALAFWESCHVTAHMVPARFLLSLSSEWIFCECPQLPLSLVLWSVSSWWPWYHCGWSQSSLLSPLTGFQSPPG